VASTSLSAEFQLVGMLCGNAGTIQGKEGGIQVLAGLTLSDQTVGYNSVVIHEQQSAAHE
jgi:hypothetical protein